VLDQAYQGRRLREPREVPVELYIRNRIGQTFYVSSLEEAIKHLVSDEGYRLSIYDAGSDTPNLVVRRMGRELAVNVHAAGLSATPPLNQIETEEEMMQRFKDRTTS